MVYKKKTILFVTPTFNSGGSEYIVRILTQFIAEKNYNVIVFTFNNDKKMYFSGNNVLIIQSVKKNLFIKAIERIFKIDFSLRKFKKTLKKFNPNVVYVNTVTLPSIIKAGYEFDFKIIMHCHESISAINNSLSNKELENIINYTEQIICVSKASARLFLDLGYSHEKIKIITPFLSNDTILNMKLETRKKDIRSELNISKDSFIVGVSALACLNKGFDRMVNLCELLEENIHVLWIGSPSNYSAFYYTIKSIQEKKINNFHYLGYIPHPEYYEYMKEIDILCISSREDTFPLVMLEATVLGKPIIAFNRTGADEFIDNENGILIENGDIAMMAHKINEIHKGVISFNIETIYKKAKEINECRNIEKIMDCLNEI